MRKRRLTRKERQNKKKKALIVMTLCLCVCLSVGYATFNTRLSLKAKGNIKEKLHCEFGGIKVNTVTSGDGLYNDIYEEGKCTYKGANPNNYILFNDEIWRIISINKDGTIKIINKQSIINDFWDYDGYNDWARPATLNTYLNETYYGSLSDALKKYIINYDWYIGASDNYDDLYNYILDEKSKVWNGKVGMITASEYLRANSNTELCGNYNLNNNNYLECYSTNYIFKNTADFWLITPSVSADYSLKIWTGNRISYSLAGESRNNVLPVINLSNDINLSGEGTEQEPFEIKN